MLFLLLFVSVASGAHFGARRSWVTFDQEFYMVELAHPPRELLHCNGSVKPLEVAAGRVECAFTYRIGVGTRVCLGQRSAHF